jgi:hypothetical protein
MEIKWEAEAKTKYEEITDSLPQFHRTIAKQLVKQKAEELAKAKGSEEVKLADLILAFAQEVPPAFKDMMKRLLAQHGIDYSKYISD